MTPDPRWRRALHALIELAAVATAVGFIGSYFPRELMLKPTITNGGDMGSHFYPAQYLSDVLLPAGQVAGWCPGNYCGFPLFQFYFFFPFLLIALAGKLVPLTVAFKLGTVLGTFLLPVASWGALRLARVPFPGPALGALAPLPFLFMEANSMWGANIPSTLAGEFCYSLGFALAVLFIGALRRTIDTGRAGVATGVLVALVGVSHGYTLLWAGFTSLGELIVTRGWWKRVGTLIVVHGLAIMLMAFWLFPLLGYAPWTTAYVHTWIINSWRELLPPILWPPAGVAVATLVLVGIVCAVKREPFPRPLAMVWWAALMGAVFYGIAALVNVVDIRFVPFVQFGLCLAAAAGLGYLLAALPMPELWPFIVGAALVPWVQSHVSFIPSWIRWNYSGYEAKAQWGTFSQMMNHLRGSAADPRVMYEHAPEYEQLGTIRIFESLPLFSGRSTLEGLYMQGSPTAPFVFYTQSEISKVMSCPFSEWGCSHLDLRQGLPHLRMFNVSQMIARSAEAKAALAAAPGVVKERSFGPFEVWRIEGNADRYAIPLSTKPVAVVGDHWKETAYRWWKNATPEDPTPVFLPALDPQDAALFGGVVQGEDLPPQLPAVPVGGTPATLSEEMGNQRITVLGTRPGEPVLIRISYHPRWQALTGERIWLAGPSFMLVFPRGERVELVWGDGPPVVIGRALSALGWIVVVVAMVPPLRRPAVAAGRRLGAAAAGLPVASSLVGVANAMAAWSEGRRRALVGVVLVLATVAVLVASYESRGRDADSVYRAGQKVYDRGDLRGAIPYFQKAQQLAPLSNTAIHSTYFEGICHVRLDEWPEVEKTFLRLVQRFPEAHAAPEGLYHVGLARARRGDAAGAAAAWEDVKARWPQSPWAKYSEQRLAEQRR